MLKLIENNKWEFRRLNDFRYAGTRNKFKFNSRIEYIASFIYLIFWVWIFFISLPIYSTISVSFHSTPCMLERVKIKYSGNQKSNYGKTN